VAHTKVGLYKSTCINAELLTQSGTLMRRNKIPGQATPHAQSSPVKHGTLVGYPTIVEFILQALEDPLYHEEEEEEKKKTPMLTLVA
jgi:hypothetical protein